MIIIGAVVRAHGVRGQFKVKPFTVCPIDVAAYGPVRLADGRDVTLDVKSVAKDLVICTADGITDRKAAETLRGQTLSVARAALPELDAAEHYHADLIGLMVMDDSGQCLGSVTALHDFGAGQIIEVADTASKTTQFHPFYPPFLIDVEPAAGRIILAAPTGSEDAGSEQDEPSHND